eukprot:5231427-Prymnesium_polylepis.1
MLLCTCALGVLHAPAPFAQPAQTIAAASGHIDQRLAVLDGAIGAFCGSSSTEESDCAARAVTDACLGLMQALPASVGSTTPVPEDGRILAEAAAFFTWADGDQLAQHIFNVQLWDDALEALACSLTRADRSQLLEAASAIAA